MIVGPSSSLGRTRLSLSALSENLTHFPSTRGCLRLQYQLNCQSSTTSSTVSHIAPPHMYPVSFHVKSFFSKSVAVCMTAGYDLIVRVRQATAGKEIMEDLWRRCGSSISDSIYR
jgi:hypothetical protein